MARCECEIGGGPEILAGARPGGRAKARANETDAARIGALEAARRALGKKAHDVVILQIGALASYTDYLVICSGDSTTQVEAIVDAVEEGFRLAKSRPIGIEGRAHGHWVLMDYGDVIVHVFLRETRDFYELEKLWLDAPRVEAVDEAAGALGRKD